MISYFGRAGGFSIRATRRVYDDGRETGTTKLRGTRTGLDRQLAVRRSAA